MDHFIDVLNSINDNYVSKLRQDFLLLIIKNLDVIDKDKVKIKKKIHFLFLLLNVPALCQLSCNILLFLFIKKLFLHRVKCTATLYLNFEYQTNTCNEYERIAFL